ncbi:helix-turn-helix domain-containing protein [Streptomyces luteogriseus]|uniref:helix-turn-helix domain-containing protein n=1 Tax=Streptomyces luteogriseus TaxID=68233 RepID=UPI0037B2E2E4
MFQEHPARLRQGDGSPVGAQQVDEFMSDEATAAVGRRAGFSPGRGFYCRGRFGVLGEASATVVQAAQGFLGPGLVTAGWLAGRSVMPAEEAASCYAQAVRVWGRAHIPGDVDVEHFNRLARQLIDAADADALPLFAGWRAHPCPTDDPVGAAMQRVHVLREHRGACHLAAVRGTSRTPWPRTWSPGGGVPSDSPTNFRRRSTPR